MNRSREELLTVLKKRQLQQQQMGRKSSRLVLLAKILTLFSIVAATYTYFLISIPTKASRKNDILLERYVQTETVAPAFEHFDGIDHPVYDLARTDEKYSGYIYLDWILSSDDFDYINYKALESLLVRYPQGKFVVLLLGPQAADYYKCGELLSKHYFQRYQKLGYHIKFQVIFKHPDPIQNIAVPYWSRMEPLCCRAKHATDIHVRDLAPHHLAAFVRIYSLYLTGGIFSDFTWLHVNAIPLSVIRGVYIREECSESGTDRESKGCYISSLYVFKSKKDPVLKCMLDAYNDESSALSRCVEVLSDGNASDSGALCVKKSFMSCFTSTGLANQLLSPLILDFDGRSILSYGTALYNLWWGNGIEGRLVDVKSCAIIWLGPSSSISDWDLPNPMSTLGSLVNENVPNRNNVAKFVTENCQDDGLSQRSQLSCSHYDVVSNRQTENRETNQAKSSCSLTFMIPGFMKAGTTFLFETLGRHPQVLMALRGVAFKETGCYLGSQMTQSRRGQRMSCYPFVEPVFNTTGNFAFGDGTVYYHNRLEIANHLKRDNPNARVIFVVRDPIERIVSHFSFTYRSLTAKLKNINELVSVAFDSNDEYLKRWRETNDVVYLLKSSGNMSSEIYLDPRVDKIVQQLRGGFMHSKDADFRRASNIILHSIYPPSILHWMRVLGREKVMIVPSEKLRLSKSNIDSGHLLSLLNEVYSFLGLCPFDRLPKQSVHTTEEEIPDNHKMNKTTKARLKQFFAPYNELLAALIGKKWTYVESPVEEFVLKNVEAEFVPTYEWKQLESYHTVPANLEIRLPLGPGGRKEARIPNPFRLQLAMPAPCKYFLRVDLFKTDFLGKILEAAAAQCKFVTMNCLFLHEKSTPHIELSKSDTVVNSELFHKSLVLSIKDRC